MADATLTSALTATDTYTSLAVTAMPDGAIVGEIIWVSITLTNVEAFVVSMPVTAGDTTIHITSAVAANDHAIGNPVAPNHTLTSINRTASPIQVLRGSRL